MSQGVVFLADFFRAWAAAGFASGSRASVARLCGFDIRETDTNEKLRIAGKAASAPDRLETPKPDARDRVAAATPEPPPERLQPRRRRISAQRTWWAKLEPLPAPSPGPIASDPPPEPLFRRHWTRAILGEIGATYLPEGEPDLTLLIEVLAHQRPLTTIPRRHVKSLRRGLYCLIDRSDRMRPFAEDQRTILRDLEGIVGRDRLTVHAFRGAPMDARSAAQPEQAPHQPILLVTDMGIGRPRFSDHGVSMADWLAYADRMHQAGHPVVALVPYPRRRWPGHPARRMATLSWDPSTTAQLAAATVRAVRRRSPR